jgi:hypothetical protein
MSAPRHSSGSGFGSSAGGAAVRGAIVIGIALVIGFLLLQQGVGDDDLLVQSEAASNPDLGTTGGDDGAETGSETGEADTDATVTTDPSNAGSVPSATTLPAPRPANEVKVTVANAARVDGAAGRATEQLRALGYTTLEAANAEEAADTSTLFYAEGYEAEALAMASEIGLDPANIAPMPDPIPVSEPPADANIVLLLGRDLAQTA